MEVSALPPPHLRRDRFLFHTGIVLLLVGGAGFLVGTFAHDPLRIPVIGDAYDGFGWVNETFLAIGLILVAVGAALAFLGLRGGVLTEEEIAELESGGSET
ncbi:MAG: hypothetical protein A3K65_08165 [Euryarchaeota archaeon RBG_16_68_12]|nr:MAG: hypothetical protein A3K65_08165 [Euryarchaeota archaeon RBG_16_68_12]